MRKNSVRRLVTLAFFAAISIVLCYVVRFPIFPAAPWLEYEPADVPMMLAAFLYGPWWGLGITVVVCGLQALTVSAGSGVIGFIMHLCATGAFVVTAGSLFLLGKRAAKRRVKDGAKPAYFLYAALSLAAGALLAIALMIPLNLWLSPLYGVSLDLVKSIMLPVILPFNAIKFSGNAVLTFILYRALAGYLRTHGFLD